MHADHRVWSGGCCCCWPSLGLVADFVDSFDCFANWEMFLILLSQLPSTIDGAVSEKPYEYS